MKISRVQPDNKTYRQSKQTHRNYSAPSFKRSNPSIKDMITESLPAKKAIKKASNFLDGDKLCIIVDRDKQSFTDLQYDVLLKAEKNGEIKFCITNPCFEFWLLLHFTDCTEYDKLFLVNNEKVGNRTYIEKCLMEKLGGSYSKTRLKFQDNYKDKIKIAIENAKKYSLITEDLKEKIGTTIGLLIEEMIDKN